MTNDQNRREFLATIGVGSAAIVGGRALPSSDAIAPRKISEKWDMAWLNRLKTAQYKAVIDASVLEDGYALDLANGLLQDHHDVHAATDDQVRIVIVFRRLGTPIVFDDFLWQKYPLGEKTEQNEGGSPNRRNPFYRPKPDASPESAATKLETLQKRGVIAIVCNIAANNVARSLAEKGKLDVAEVKKDVFAHLVPGTIVMPSGVFALMRAQNAGCAYMRGS